MLPFGLLLACMAVIPLHWPRWWKRHYAKVALSLASITLGYYLFVLPNDALETVNHMGENYAGFVCLIGSLYVISGGIQWRAERSRSALWNTTFLALGGLLANLLGTMGASIVLIRPWLEVNRSRMAAHHVVFFIFIISNVGGGLTPLGDPPLLMGFLGGVPFFWVMKHAWPMWLLSMSFLLAIFYLIDRKTESDSHAPFSTFAASWSIFGLAIVLATVLIPMPWWARNLFMIAAAAISYVMAKRRHEVSGRFSLKPMIEVAILFFAIFATVMPAVDRLKHIGGHLTPGGVYWSSGLLSAFLDSAPAYLAFFNAAGGDEKILLALSVGTVLFGAVTYIGNGPNLMIKTIADDHKFASPSFLGYLFKWAVPILLPLIILQWLIFFR